MNGDIIACSSCGQKNRVGDSSRKAGEWKCGKCGKTIRVATSATPEDVETTIAASDAAAPSQECAICRASVAPGHKALGKHLWDQHRLTPNDYRVRHLGLAPKCKRPGCDNPVSRSAAGGWFACCSIDCALEMREDLPIGRSFGGSTTSDLPPGLAMLSQSRGKTDYGCAMILCAVVVLGFLSWVFFR